MTKEIVAKTRDNLQSTFDKSELSVEILQAFHLYLTNSTRPSTKDSGYSIFTSLIYLVFKKFVSMKSNFGSPLKISSIYQYLSFSLYISIYIHTFFPSRSRNERAYDEHNMLRNCTAWGITSTKRRLVYIFISSSVSWYLDTATYSLKTIKLLLSGSLFIRLPIWHDWVPECKSDMEKKKKKKEEKNAHV